MSAHTGRMNKYNPERGFGFIKPYDQSIGDVFCHASVFITRVEEISIGTELVFDIVPSARKPGSWQATNVRIVPKPVRFGEV
jgi:cold shock CspA family protein